ncbi:hypothetical protein JX265_003683 [Neoarthrinium moseri]|uniref:LOV domain-containing protein n=1 Tax=Neoarthrinium moseri TaxID=1658444 RepID=A0A9P9WT77_9PEZI|nr:hypothetical protein JX265_003683 [Neoarthrinium moseri]
MSHSSRAADPMRSKGSNIEFRRMSTPLISTNYNYMDTALSPPRVFSPPPTPRSPPPRPDRLSLRLRSNSGMKLHTNEAALSQYIDYQSNGQYSVYKANGYAGSTVELGQPNIGSVLSPRDAPASSRQTVAWTTSGMTSSLPFLDFLGKDAFQMAIENPSVIRHFIRYCEHQGCEENVDFLMKIREYNSALNDMTSVLTSISTTYTAIGASIPLNLPPMVSRPLNADIKRIAHSIIPSLESVFFESKSHIENELAQDVFPGFVKSQLVNCTSAALASEALGNSSQWQYPGLGTCFSMTDASDSKNPIVMASDDFESLTGYPLAEIIGQNSGFLQGPFTDPEAIRRIQVAMRNRRECVELILNHHKNGEPFWNLLCLLPLKDAQGMVQYWLGAQVNVSDCMGSRKDLLRVLNGGQPLETDSIDGSTVLSDPSSGRDTPNNGRSRKGSMAHSRRESKAFGTSRNRLFPTFRKSPPPCPPSPPPGSDVGDAVSVTGSKKSKTSQYSSQRFQPRPKAQISITAYSHYMVLRCVNGGGATNQRLPTPSVRKKHSTKLMVAFYSDAVSELLSVRSDISQADVFHVLGEKANSPSVTKAFKSSVREGIDDGESVSLELLLERGRKRRASAVSNSTRPTSYELDVTQNDERSDRKSAKLSKHEKLWSHWTPMKDGNGNVDWVVLIISPGA